MPGMISFMTLDPDVLSPEAPGCHQVACAPHGWVGVGEHWEPSQWSVRVRGVQRGGLVWCALDPSPHYPRNTL